MRNDAEQNQRRAEDRGGPFPERRSAEHPWEAAETVRGPFERRRAGDRRAPDPAAETGEARTASDRRRYWGRRKSDVLSTAARASLAERSRVFVHRFRTPLIGLTLAGVAAPLFTVGVRAVARPRAGAGERAEPAARPPLGVPAQDLETSVGQVWASSDEATVRDQTIEGAVVRYNIEHDLATRIYDAAARYSIEPDVAYGLVYTESSFRPQIVSNVGARGLTQMLPRTARWLDPGLTAGDLFDPVKNLDVGFRYLRRLIDRYNGDVETALTAYNRGPTTVDRILAQGGNPDNGYAGRVLAG